MRDYTGQTIYLGMDVHKKSYSVSAICGNVVVKRDRLPADPEELLKYCKRFFPNAKIYSAYEAGFSGFGLHRFLVENNIKNIIVHPASIATPKNDRVKTDKIDSLKIALELSKGSLKGIHIPSQEQQSARSVTRFRATCMKERSRCVNRIKGFLHFLGIDLTFRLSEKKCNQLRNLNLSENDQFCLNLLLDEWGGISQTIKTCEKQLKQQSVIDELETYYKSAPGVGHIIARVLSNELGDMTQFENERRLFSYCGLTPSEYSSGEKVRRGHITRQGKPSLRMYLTQAAWRAIRKDPALKEDFDRIAVEAGRKRSIQAIARKLIGRIRACVLKREYYKLGKQDIGK